MEVAVIPQRLHHRKGHAIHTNDQPALWRRRRAGRFQISGLTTLSGQASADDLARGLVTLWFEILRCGARTDR